MVDIGCGYGGLSLAYALSGREAFAVDLDPRNLEVVGSRVEAGESGRGVVRPVRASALSLPLADGSADLGLMIGVLEWMGYADLSARPRDLQRRALAEAARVLKREGKLILGTKNRFFPRYAWSDAQAGRPLLNVLPPGLADTLSTKLWRQRYRGRIRSYWGWRRLIDSAGLRLVATFVPVFNYQFPLVLADPWSPRSIGAEIESAIASLPAALRYAAVDVGRRARIPYYRALGNAGLLGLGAGSFLFVCEKLSGESS